MKQVLQNVTKIAYNSIYLNTFLSLNNETNKPP